MKVRLSAGRPATRTGGGSSARLAKEAVEPKKPPTWQPNQEPDTPLACGCKIPWPIVTLLGSGGMGGVKARQVMCDVHGWQPQLTKAAIEKAQRRMKQWQSTRSISSTTQSTLADKPPF